VKRVSVACVAFTIKLLSENRRNTFTPLQITVLVSYSKLNYVHKSQRGVKIWRIISINISEYK
jgi:hypothetical protein